MLKKITLCLFSFALLLGTGNTLFAQKEPEFTAVPKTGRVFQLPGDTKLDLQNAAELTPEELRVALETSSCGTAKEQKAPTFCAACTGTGCTGTCYRIPCGTYINANQQVPPAAGFLSFIIGCRTTYVSTCNDLNGVAPCRLFAFNTNPPDPNGWPDNSCISSSAALQSVGCI
jgi:hypothetical protein